ncbi:MAG: Na+/H+ antiporter NhaC family protein [Peptostreptococcaceae bacterium]
MKKIILMVMMMFFMSSTNSFATDISDVNAGYFGIFTLIPPVVAIFLAFLTKNVVVSLFLGIYAGCILLTGSPFTAFLDVIDRGVWALADPWNAGIILQVLSIGGVIHLVSKMGGSKAIAETLATKAKTARSTQLTTWFMGLLVFFDDYANALIVGPIMRPIADKMKISRERLAFVIDATAAPIAGLAIISTWVGLEVGLINDGLSSIGIDADAFGVFIETIPYRFYNILILAFIVISTVLMKDFGPMRDAQIRAINNKEGLSRSNLVESDLEPKEGVKLSVWNAIIPIGTLIISALFAFYYSGYSYIMGSEDLALIQLFETSPMSFNAIKEAFSASDASVALLQSSILASIVAIIMGVSKKIFTVSEAIETWCDGMKSLIITGVILVLAWSLSSVIKELGTAKYIITLLSGNVAPFLLPSIIFILGSIISFSTGTAYGTMGILMPLAIPLSHAINPEMGYITVSISAVLTGAIFGDHCSPISDTTILSSMGAGCNHIDHVKTQMPYALFTAAIAILFGYIPAGLGLPIYLIMPVALFIVFIGIQVLGKRVDEVQNIDNN